MSDLPKHVSTRADHPDVAPILPRFIARLSGHVARLHQLHATGDRDELQRLAHQLRGSGKTFGFERLTELAHNLEETLQSHQPAHEVTTALHHLTQYMEHVEGYAQESY